MVQLSLIEDHGKLTATVRHLEAKLLVVEKALASKSELLRDAVQVLSDMSEQETCPGCGYDGSVMYTIDKEQPKKLKSVPARRKR